ncbi:DUF4192 domain-containing protein [Phycicoccus avicenniae]|uniref:DUF4192 domain-containing protein n=1 Tax=Phycicoccus avicenniae TaxID=2828860 RepID=UPI003D2D1C97
MTTHIGLRGPGDVLAVLPYQLGYHPRRSVVALALEGRRVGLVLRVDLPPEDHVEPVVRAVVDPLLRNEVRRVLLVGYEDTEDECRPLLMRLVECLEAERVTVLEVDVVRAGRRYSPVCSQSCCPVEGEPVPAADAVPAVAELVALGRAPLADRAAVDRLVEPEAVRSAGVAVALADRPRTSARRRRREAVAAWGAVLAPGRSPGGREPPAVPDAVVAAAVAGLRDIALRDAVIAWLSPTVLPRASLDPVVLALLERTMPRWAGMGSWPPHPSATADRGNPGERGDPAERDAVLQRVLVLCRSVPDDRPEDAAAVCTLAAHVAWALGEGAQTRAALDRALRLDPGYRLARLLARLVEHGIRLDRRLPGGRQLGRAG